MQDYKYNISILCSGIRPYNWVRLYESIFLSSKKHSWEIIFVGPYPLPEELEDKDNITYIEDFGSPIRCHQIALVNSRGKYVSWIADDGYFYEDSLDIGFNLIKPNSVVMQKYYEGSINQELVDNKYYKLDFHNATRANYISKEYYTFNGGLVPRDMMVDLGGWDCCLFEVCSMANADFAVRLQKAEIKIFIQEEMAVFYSHTPGIEGDHAPIHYAQITHDEPVFKQLYNSPESVDRIKIDIDNWKRSPERWVRRFGKQGDIA